MDTIPTNPAVPADILTMLRADAPGLVNAAVIAPAVSPPPGVAPMPTVADTAAAPQVDPAPVFDPAAGFKAAIAKGIAENAPGAQVAAVPAPPAAPVVGAAVPALADVASRYVGTKPRRQIVPLEWPVEIDGVTWTEIPCERMTGRELDAFYDATPEQRAHLPTIKAPHAVLDALDADDLVAVRGVALSFLPRALIAETASPPPPSDTSSDTSAGTSANA